jgi:hypothetical protein
VSQQTKGKGGNFPADVEDKASFRLPRTGKNKDEDESSSVDQTTFADFLVRQLLQRAVKSIRMS